MIRRGIWGVAVIAALLMSMGAGGAWASGLPVHRGQIGGVIKPLDASWAAAQGNSPAAKLFGAGIPGGGSPSPACQYCSPPLLYWGGPVMHSVTTHVIAWAPPGSSFPTGYVNQYQTFLADLRANLSQSSNISSVAEQYVDASGSALTSLTIGPVITDNASPSPSTGCTVSGAALCLSDTQIENQIASVIDAPNSGLTADLSQSYIVLLPPGVDSCYLDGQGQWECEAAQFCGYHSNLAIGSAETTYTLLPYTQSTYSNSYPAGSDCTDPSVTTPGDMTTAEAALDSGGVHELLESATDPVVDTGYLDQYQGQPAYEIGDECAYVYGSTNVATGGGVYNQLLNHTQYLLQEMWSNQDNNCQQGDASFLSASISSTPTVATGAPTTLTATLHGASASGVTYDWSYADQYGDVTRNVDSGSYPSPQLVFRSPGTYTVWVQITDSAGDTVVGVTSVDVANSPTSQFAWSPSNVQAGTSVSFFSGAYAGTGAITGYSWDFGDGSTSTAATPAHTYASAGTYTVTLTVTQSDGLTSSMQHTVVVTAASSSPSASGSSGSSGTGGYTGPTGTTANTSWLTKTLGASAGQLRIPALLKNNVTTTTVSSVTVSGKLTITWYATVRHRKIVVARGAQTVSAGVAAHISIKLTAAGRALIKRSRTLRITVLGSYKFGTHRIKSTRTLTLKQ